MDQDLQSQASQIWSQFKQLLCLNFLLAKQGISLAFSIFLFIISCGTMVGLRRRPSSPPANAKSESEASEGQSSDSQRYQYKNEMSRFIPKSASREALNEIMYKHSFSRKQSWALSSKEPEDIIVIPSLSVDPQEMAKITAAHLYEERQLCTLFYLRNPNVRLIYVTSMPVDRAIVNYYLRLIEQTSLITYENARKRLYMLNCNDSSPLPLSAKILRRPRIIEKIKQVIDPSIAFITCFISSNLEREIALKIGVPLFANDPALSYWGTKSGSREVFQDSGITYADGTQLVHTVDDLVLSIENFYTRRNFALDKIVVKLNIGFSGEGNALLNCKHFDRNNLQKSILNALENHLEYVYELETWATFMEKLQEQGVLVEEWVPNVVESPSCQALINSQGIVEVLSTHEQMLKNNSIYLGCKFPADAAYRKLLIENTKLIGQTLKQKGCLERFAVDYVISYEDSKPIATAIEINLRWGGTSHPMIFAKSVTDSELTDDGLLLACDDCNKFYIATDNVKHEDFTGLNPEDFLEIVDSFPELQFDSETLTGVTFHLLAAIPVYGKFGFLAIGNSVQQAQEIYEQALDTLKREVSKLASEKKNTELDLNYNRPKNQLVFQMALLHRNALQGTKEFEASEIDKTNHSIEIINSGKKDRSWLEINKYMVMLEYLFICAYVFIIYFKQTVDEMQIIQIAQFIASSFLTMQCIGKFIFRFEGNKIFILIDSIVQFLGLIAIILSLFSLREDLEWLEVFPYVKIILLMQHCQETFDVKSGQRTTSNSQIHTVKCLEQMHTKNDISKGKKKIIQKTMKALNENQEGQQNLHTLQNSEIIDCLTLFQNWEFDVFYLQQNTNQHALSSIVLYIFDQFLCINRIDRDVLENFVCKIERGYKSTNLYHNSVHAADVTQSFFYIFNVCEAINKIKLTEEEQLTCYIAAAIHDYKHPGVNNQFLINTQHNLAWIYNDISVLENFHLSEALQLMKKDQYNIWKQFELQGLQQHRKLIIEMVLATDASNHNMHLQKIKEISKISFKHQTDVLCNMLHLADISSPCRPWEQCQKWAYLVTEEFFLQGDEERKLQLPLGPLMDRFSLNIPQSQIGFIEYLVMPLMKQISKLIPDTNVLLSHLNENKHNWGSVKDNDDTYLSTNR